MAAVQASPLRPGAPLQFTVLRVPFFLEPDYPTTEEFEVGGSMLVARPLKTYDVNRLNSALVARACGT